MDIRGVVVFLGMALIGLAPPVAFSQESGSTPPAETADEIQSRGVSIAGCEIKYKTGLPDFNALKSCINGKIDKVQDDAKKATDAAKAQTQGIQSELNNLKNSPLLAKLEGERRMLEAVRTLNLEPFFTCLNQNQSLQPQFTSRIQLLASNPGKFAADLTNEIWTIAQQRSQALMSEHLQALRTPAGPGDFNQVADRSIRIFTQLASEHPVTRCILPRLNPQIAMIKQSALQIAPQLEARMKITFDQSIAPVLNDIVAKAMGTMLKSLPQILSTAQTATKTTIQFLIPEEVESIANGIAFRHIFTKDLVEGRTLIDQMASAVGNPSTSLVAFGRLQQSVREDDVIPEVLRFEVGHAILRYAGHKYIDCTLPGCAGDTVMQMLGASTLLKDIVVEVISAVCSLADIAGGGVCGAGETVTPNGIYATIVLPKIHQAAIAGLHGAFDGAMNLHRDAILKGYDPRTRREQAGPLMAMVDLLPTKEVVAFFADSQVRTMHAAFKSYNASVLRLAEAATRR